MYCRKNIVMIIMALFMMVCSTAYSADVTITPDNGGFRVHTGAYDVAILSDGCLASLQTGGASFLNSSVGFNRAGYFHQGNLVGMSSLAQQDGTVVGKSDAASIKYEFGPNTITCNLTNSSSAPMAYYMIFDEAIKVVANPAGQYMVAPVNVDCTSATFFRNDMKVRAEGCGKLWGPWNSQQVFDVGLGVGETRKVVLTVDRASDAEKVAVAKAYTPTELQVADLNVLSPRQYQVFQRTSRYNGYIVASGWVRPACDKVKIRVLGKSLKGALPGKWENLPLNAQTRAFASRIPTNSGGWYAVEFRALKGSKVVAQAKVQNVGVGEVFVGAGQSNSTNCGQERTKQTSGMVSSFSGAYWQIADDPQPGPHDKTSGGSFWPSFGDAMYARYHVPIGVAVTGHGGTSVAQWQPNSGDGLFEWMMTRIYQLGPMGFRAVLWHQGETDAVTPTDVYVQKMTTLIRRSNIDAGWDFPWFVAWASYHNPEHTSWPLVRAAQKQLWDTGIAMQGPDTDTLQGDNRDFNGAGIHFSPKGCLTHGQMWAEKVGAYVDSLLDREKK
ncbi:MAG: sialate O-acetylesterase [Armatimonadota bacterium]|nr:sialate O-acetylesterase [bacterium]